jgi:hypothetical protein
LGEGDKREWWKGKYNDNDKNFCKCYDIPPPSTIIKEKNKNIKKKFFAKKVSVIKLNLLKSQK